MNLHYRKAFWGVFTATLVAGAVPVLAYWYLFNRVPTVAVQEAQRLLADTNASVLLVDLRPREVFGSDHIPGSVNWPYAEIREWQAGSPMPDAVRAKSLLLICDTGLSSALAAHKLVRAGQEALNVRGGMIQWQSVTGSAPFRAMNGMEQALVVSLVFVIKPFYMLVATILIVVLWRASARDLTFFRWGLIVWWLGENACSANYLFFNRISDFWEYLHNYGMAAGFSLMAYAFIEGLDHRFIKFTEPKERCALLGLCRGCYKYAPGPCGLQRLFHITIPASIALSLIPLTAHLKSGVYSTTIFGTSQQYSHMISCQVFEDRYCALTAFVLLLGSWLVLLFKKSNPMPWAKVLFAAAMGPLSFGLMRLFLFGVFNDNLAWFDIWEEYTEMFFLLGIGMGLWVFRRSLFAPEPPGKSPPAAVPA